MENSWVWGVGREERVEPRVWLETPQESLEENCLLWRLTTARDGVLGADCCHYSNFICQL